ncbi:integrase family protein [Geomonas nitrogeniifigens]|uniref:Integrase family protein n=1 Tax=Geomonas diazotrophica TaxID=2843197 RepID=A0ABX8JHK7_9BACT|nr:tyrosine-type recombinase/integrase [Geomonas nitrogeniifigens]QWV97476.1 integrase family protein [Geomonas nitrogeniifigens]
MADKIKLTKTVVEDLPVAEKGKQTDYFDSQLEGFGIRVSATGKKYFVRRTVAGKRVRVMLGSHPTMTAEMARSQARIKLGVMETGVDPNEEKRQAVREAEAKKQKGVTLQSALDDYVQNKKLKASTITNYKDLFRTYLSDWLLRSAADITREMVLDRHRDIANGKRRWRVLEKGPDPDGVKRGGKAKVKSAEAPETKRKEAAADNCMRTLRAILNYAFEEDEGDTPYMNPVNVLSSKKHKAWFKVGRRRTLIKNSSLPAWYKAIVALDNGIVRDYLLFTLFTGLRRNEVATLRWSHVDFEESCFTVVDTKNGDPHALPLSNFLYQLLQERKDGLKVELEAAQAARAEARITTAAMTKKQQQAVINRLALAESRMASPYVFPGEGKSGHIVSPKRALEEVLAATGIKFSCHDLRRTFATIAESLDLSKYTIKDLLNHKRDETDVTGGYIVLEVERLRGPMQKITDAIQERIKKQHGQVLALKVGE